MQRPILQALLFLRKQSGMSTLKKIWNIKNTTNKRTCVKDDPPYIYCCFRERQSSIYLLLLSWKTILHIFTVAFVKDNPPYIYCCFRERQSFIYLLLLSIQGLLLPTLTPILPTFRHFVNISQPIRYVPTVLILVNQFLNVYMYWSL
jgi:hypothetical protein